MGNTSYAKYYSCRQLSQNEVFRISHLCSFYSKGEHSGWTAYLRLCLSTANHRETMVTGSSDSIGRLNELRIATKVAANDQVSCWLAVTMTVLLPSKMPPARDHQLPTNLLRRLDM